MKTIALSISIERKNQTKPGIMKTIVLSISIERIKPNQTWDYEDNSIVHKHRENKTKPNLGL